MPEGDPVYVEPPEGLYEHNDTVWSLKRALNGLRDASRLFHEHFAAVLTSRLGFTRSEAQPTLFVDLARDVFIAVHVDDLIMVGSSSQLHEVVGEMKQYFTMKVTHPLSARSTQTFAGARYLRNSDAIWELPTTRYVRGMLNEHGMKDTKLVVTPAVNRNDDDDEEDEASVEERCILRRIVGKSPFLAPRRPDIAVPGKTYKIGHDCVETSLAISAGYDGFRTDNHPKKKLRPSGCKMNFTISKTLVGRSVALFLTSGKHVNIHLRSDSFDAIGVASRGGLQRLRHLDVRFLWLQAETAMKNVRIRKVPGPENVADANTKPQDKRSLEFCRLNMGVTEIPRQFPDTVL